MQTTMPMAPRLTPAAKAFFMRAARTDKEAWCFLELPHDDTGTLTITPVVSATAPQRRHGVPSTADEAAYGAESIREALRKSSGAKISEFIDLRRAHGCMHGIIAHTYYDDLASVVTGDLEASARLQRAWDVEAFAEGTMTRTLGTLLGKRGYAVSVCAYGTGDAVMMQPLGGDTTPIVCMLVYWGRDMPEAAAGPAGKGRLA